MKRIYQLMLLAAGCVLLAAACSDDDDSYLAVSYTHLTLPTNREV